MGVSYSYVSYKSLILEWWPCSGKSGIRLQLIDVPYLLYEVTFTVSSMVKCPKY